MFLPKRKKKLNSKRPRLVYDHIRQNWITQFLNRLPELAARYARRIDRQRVHANNPLSIKDHFRKLEALIRTHIEPNAISNVDEKGFLLGQSTKAKVVGQRRKKNPHIKQHGSREMVTLIEAVTASGFVYPPFLITKWKVHIANFFRTFRWPGVAWRSRVKYWWGGSDSSSLQP